MSSEQPIQDLGHWQYSKPLDPSLWFGFIYRIVDNLSGKHYLGKKQFFSHTTKAVVGKKNRKHITKESTWKKYIGSSTHLNAAIAEKGKENFSFYIESLHVTKGSLYYAEVDVQIKENALRERLPSGERKYYNKQIACIKFLPPLETAEEAAAKSPYQTGVVVDSM